jgi:hypothetical protein
MCTTWSSTHSYPQIRKPKQLSTLVLSHSNADMETIKKPSWRKNISSHSSQKSNTVWKLAIRQLRIQAKSNTKIVTRI